MGKLKSGAIISYIYLFIESLSSILLTPLLVSYLGDSEYGVYGLAATVSSYILLLDLGVGNALVRYFAKYHINGEEDNQKKLMGVSLIFYAGVSIIAGILLFITVFFLPHLFSKGLTAHEVVRAKYMFIVVGLNSIITLLEAPFKRIIIAYEKFVLSKAISLIKVILRFLLVSLVLFNGGLGVAVLVVSLLLTVAGLLFELGYTLFKLKVVPTFKGIEKSFFKEIFSYSSIIMLQMLATQINAMVDQVAISIFIPAASTCLAIYYVGINITHYYQSIGGAVNSLLMPRAVRAAETGYDNKAILDLMVKVSRIQVAILGLIYIVFLVNGKQFIDIWVGSSKEYSYLVAAIIMLPQFLFLTQSVGTHLLWAYNKHKIQAILQLVVAILNIGLTVLLVNVMEPILGASIGTAVSSLVGNVIVFNYVSRKELKISIREYYKRQYHGILPCLVITLLASMLFNYFVPLGQGIISFCVKCMFAVLVYIVLMWFKGLNESEKRMLIKRKR